MFDTASILSIVEYHYITLHHNSVSVTENEVMAEPTIMFTCLNKCVIFSRVWKAFLKLIIRF